MAKPKKAKGLESLGGLIFSTGPEPISGNDSSEEFEEIDPSSIDLRVSLDRKNRKGKAVTLITGFDGLDLEDLKDLAKMLKSKCGVGGGAKNDHIIVQGDHVNKVMELLKAEGFRVKRSGG
ncbi:MAG: translation initiation factor [Flavobacteriales bacterium]|jgi:translation initiation factor 1|nr:translation initiation factor [Flavobacteriales bacterium]